MSGNVELMTMNQDAMGMEDISEKGDVVREAVVSGRIILKSSTMEKILC
ncbi:MAG: hypothetical protein IMF19_15630 [Proteobacteria bacterium]|nr:hypothetical protein [Pseudomonadota bacterium]